MGRALRRALGLVPRLLGAVFGGMGGMLGALLHIVPRILRGVVRFKGSPIRRLIRACAVVTYKLQYWCD